MSAPEEEQEEQEAPQPAAYQKRTQRVPQREEDAYFVDKRAALLKARRAKVVPERKVGPERRRAFASASACMGLPPSSGQPRASQPLGQLWPRATPGVFLVLGA